jgi:hypothetical protein
MVLILPESEELHSVIHEINVHAFGGENREKLVEKLWKSSSFNPTSAVKGVF